MRATYQRPHGVEHLLGFYDVHADCFAGVFVKRQRVVDLTDTDDASHQAQRRRLELH